MPTALILKKYLSWGGELGNMISYQYLGKVELEHKKYGVMGVEDVHQKMLFWQKEYVRRGFRAIPLDAFVGYGGYNKSIDEFINVKNSEK